MLISPPLSQICKSLSVSTEKERKAAFPFLNNLIKCCLSHWGKVWHVNKLLQKCWGLWFWDCHPSERDIKNKLPFHQPETSVLLHVSKMLRSSRLLAKVCKYFFLRISHPSLLQVGFSSLSPLVLRDITKMFWVFLSKSVIVCVWHLVFLQVGFLSLSLRTQKWKSAMPQRCDKSPKMLHVLWASSVSLFFIVVNVPFFSVGAWKLSVASLCPITQKLRSHIPQWCRMSPKKSSCQLSISTPSPHKKKKKWKPDVLPETRFKWRVFWVHCQNLMQ